VRGVAALIVWSFFAAGTGVGQDTTTPRPDSAKPDSAPPPPTAAQVRYLEGLRTAGRGIAQLKDGVGRVVRMQSDSVKRRQAGARLGGLCSAARGFMASGRAQMLPTAYDLPTRTPAKLLAVRIDSIIAYTPTCSRTASKNPAPVATEVLNRIRLYEAALVAFRTALGLPNRSTDSTPQRRTRLQD